MAIMNLDDPNVWPQACEQWTTLFWHVMPMDMENLAIIQHYDRLHYATIQRASYQPWVCRFESKDYVYMQETSIMLDVITWHVIYLYVRCYLGNVVVGGSKWFDMEGPYA
jgi:hypothetical protein